MLSTEFSPLIDANSKNNSHTKCKSLRYLSILVLCVIGAFLVYYYSSAFQFENVSKFFLNENAAIAKWYPTQREIDEYRSKTVVIEYSTEDLPETVDFAIESDAMRVFHNNLIAKHGYNSNDYNIHFVVMDDDIVMNEVTDTLGCSTMYTFSFEAGFMEVNCADYFQKPMQVTGCVSYEPDTNGFRRGETGYESSDCCVTSEDTGLTMLTGRCCLVHSVSDTELTTSYTSSTDSTSNEYCLGVECDSDYTAMGCGATLPLGDITETSSGVKRTQSDNTGKTGCKAQRSMSGDLYIAPYCGILTSSAGPRNIKCKTRYGSSGELLNARSTKYVSRAQCVAPRKLTDCDNEIKSEINSCKQKQIGEDKGLIYGGVINKRKCVALGDSENIMAIATCCEVV